MREIDNNHPQRVWYQFIFAAIHFPRSQNVSTIAVGEAPPGADASTLLRGNDRRTDIGFAMDFSQTS